MRRCVKRGVENDADYDFVLPCCLGQDGTNPYLIATSKLSVTRWAVGFSAVSRSIRATVVLAGLGGPTEDRDCAGFGRLHRASLNELVDRRGYQWFLTHWSASNVWGDVAQSECDPYLPWDAGGSTTSGFVSLSANNPYPSDFCAHWFAYDGTILRGGCNRIVGTWSNYWGNYGDFDMTKTCEVPSSETTSQTGGLWYGSYYLFPATVDNTSGGNLSGRLYREVDYATANDNCWYPGSPIPYWSGVTGGDRFLDSSNTYVDTIGWGDAAVQHYRANNNAPCSVDLHQRMQIACGNEIVSSPWHTVKSQVLHVEIGTTTLTTSRGSVTQGPQPY